MHTIDTLPATLLLGNRGDFGHEVVFDVTAWMSLSPDTWKITYMRPGETDVYPVDSGDIAVATADGVTTLTWTVSAAVTSIEGSGSVIIEAYEGVNLLKHSDWAQAIIGPGHAAAGTAPEPLASYIEKWAAVDLAVEDGEPGAPSEGSVSQDGDGTHLSLSIRPGNGIASIQRTDGDGSPDTTDTYTVTMDNGDTATFTVTNGPTGPTGPAFTYADFTPEQLEGLRGTWSINEAGELEVTYGDS